VGSTSGTTREPSYHGVRNFRGDGDCRAENIPTILRREASSSKRSPKAPWHLEKRKGKDHYERKHHCPPSALGEMSFVCTSQKKEKRAGSAIAAAKKGSKIWRAQR